MTNDRGVTRRQVIKGGAAGLAAALAAGALPGVTRAAGNRAPLSMRKASAPTGGNSISMFGWDIADTTAGLGKGFQAVKDSVGSRHREHRHLRRRAVRELRVGRHHTGARR